MGYTDNMMINEKGNDMNYLAALPTADLVFDLSEALRDVSYYTNVFPHHDAARRAAYLARDIEAELATREQDPWTTDADRRYFEGAN